MGLFKVLKKVAIGAAIGIATYGIGTALTAGIGGATAAGATTSATVSGGLKAASKGGIRALASGSGGSKGGPTPQPPDIQLSQNSSSVKDILGKGGPTQTARAGGQNLFSSKSNKNSDILENPWQHTDDWFNDLGGEGKPSDWINKYV